MTLNHVIHSLKLNIIGMTAAAQHNRYLEQKALSIGYTFHENARREMKEEAPSLENVKADEAEWDKFYKKYQNLRDHRVHILRKKARENFLVYAFLRGVPYSSIEEVCHNKLDFDELEKAVFNAIDPKEVDPREVKQRYEQWVQEAKKVD